MYKDDFPAQDNGYTVTVSMKNQLKNERDENEVVIFKWKCIGHKEEINITKTSIPTSFSSLSFFDVYNMRMYCLELWYMNSTNWWPIFYGLVAILRIEKVRMKCRILGFHCPFLLLWFWIGLILYIYIIKMIPLESHLWLMPLAAAMHWKWLSSY